MRVGREEMGIKWEIMDVDRRKGEKKLLKRYK